MAFVVKSSEDVVHVSVPSLDAELHDFFHMFFFKRAHEHICKQRSERRSQCNTIDLIKVFYSPSNKKVRLFRADHEQLSKFVLGETVEPFGISWEGFFDDNLDGFVSYFAVIYIFFTFSDICFT